MNCEDLTDRDLELVNLARDLVRKRRTGISTVASVLRTGSNRIFSGVNIFIEASAPCSICAECAAIGAMVTEGEGEIDAIVAVSHRDLSILAPCGRCRQLLNEFGDPHVIIEGNNRLKKVKLRELYPLPVDSK